MDLEATEHVPLLPAAQEAVDRQGDRDHQHRYPRHDQRVAEDEQDQAGDPEEDEADVQQRDQVVDPGDELGQHAGLACGWGGPEALEHASSPAGALPLFLVYCPETDRVYAVDIEEAASGIGALRVAPTANCQTKGVRWAADHELPA